jgi:transcriptional regulator with XRE-family HTH domain
MWAWSAFMLRFLRLQHGMSGDDLAKLLNCARSSISRLENNESQLSDRQAAILDKTWNTGDLFATVIYYARLGHEPNWFKTFTEYEARASVMKIYSGQVIPALFQIPGYIRELMVAGREADVEVGVESRTFRQTLLGKQDPPELWVLLAETAFQCLVGGSGVMHGQLQSLLEFSRLPNVTLRVVPNAAGANLGLDGPFKIIKTKDGWVAYIDAPNGGRLVMEPAEVESLTLRFDRIGAQALPVHSSRKLIEQHLEALNDFSGMAQEQ